MRYIIIGAGAVGGTIGGCLALAGHEVVLVARGAHLETMRDRGLRLSTPAGTDTVKALAIGGPEKIDLSQDDALVVTTKSQDSLAVLSDWAARPVAGGGTAGQCLPVVCAQNGVANERFALRRFRHVYGMCVWLPATHVAPGEVAAHGMPMAGLLWVGRYPAGTDATIERVAADLIGSRFLAPVSSSAANTASPSRSTRRCSGWLTAPRPTACRPARSPPRRSSPRRPHEDDAGQRTPANSIDGHPERFRGSPDSPPSSKGSLANSTASSYG